MIIRPHFRRRISLIFIVGLSILALCLLFRTQLGTFRFTAQDVSDSSASSSDISGTGSQLNQSSPQSGNGTFSSVSSIALSTQTGFVLSSSSSVTSSDVSSAAPSDSSSSESLQQGPSVILSQRASLNSFNPEIVHLPSSQKEGTSLTGSAALSSDFAPGQIIMNEAETRAEHIDPALKAARGN